MVNTAAYHALQQELSIQKISLVAVSKFKSAEDIQALYNEGQRDFGENYVQELVEKQALLPADIRWHFIGHLQTNKVKYIAPFVYLIQGVDSAKLLKEIQKQAIKNQRTINVLLQVHIATEDTKFGLDEEELAQCLSQSWEQVNIVGLMGMASFSDDQQQVAHEMKNLKRLFELHKEQFQILEGYDQPILSMGMSGDYPLAIECGSTMVRVGSLLFGRR